MTNEAGQDRSYFGGYIRDMFQDAATVEIWESPVLKKGDLIRVARENFAKQMPGPGRGAYVEGVVFTDRATGQREYKHVTVIV